MTATVTLFGAPDIVVQGETRTPDTRKAIALLAYLALEGPTVRRDRLAWLLWPESTQERARGALRRTLTSLRRSIGAAALTATREAITLDPRSVGIDVLAFRAAIARGEADQAVPLYRGEFLAGFSLRDAPDFDEWHRLESDALRNEADAALAELTRGAIESGRPAAAAGHGLRRIELNALNEDAHRSLMLAYAHLGRRSDAIAQYRELVRILDDELGVAPLPETVELYETIRRGEVATVSATRPPLPVPTTVPEVTGRDAELARFEAVLASGRPAVIEVLGGTATGKTSLLQEMARRAEVWDRPAIVVRCAETEQGLAFAPVASMLRSALGGSVVDETVQPHVAPLLEGYRAGEPDRGERSDGPGSRARLFGAWLLALEQAGFERAVLLVDDVHHADAASLEFLRFLSGRGSGHVVLVTTAVPGGTSIGADGEVIDLGATSSRAAGRRVSLDALAPVERQLIEAVAIIDRATDVDLLRRVVGRTEDEVVDAADRLIGAGMLHATGDGALEIADTALREAATSEMSPVRANLLHRRTAAALETQITRAGEAAGHYELGGRGDLAAVLYATAAAQAQQRFANADALAHVRSALALGHEDRTMLHTLAGDLETLEGRYRDALRSYETAAALAMGDELAGLEHKLGALHLRLGDAAGAASHLASALTEVVDDEPLRARVLAARAAATERLGDIGTARKLAAAAVDTAEAAGDIETEARAHGVAGLVALAAGDAGAARSFLHDSLRRAELSRSFHTAAAAHNGLGLVSLGAGDPATAADHFTAAIDTLQRVSDRHALAAASSNLADALHALGSEAAANEALIRSAALMADIGGSPLDGLAGVWGLTSW